MQKSFLKLKKSNYKFLDDIIPLIHSFRKKNLKEQTFIEPFLGTGSVFLNVQEFNNFILNDLSVNIFMLFSQIKNNPTVFIEDTKKLFTSESKEKIFFENMVRKYIKNNDYYEMCQIFVYLNRHAVQGITSLNKYGKYKNPYFPKKEINLMHEKLSNNKVSIFNHTFERIFENLEYADVIYCNPPDIEKLNTNIDFSYEQHKVLTQLATTACLKGSSIIISNSYNEITKELYKDCSEYYIKKIKTSIFNQKIEKEKIIAIYA